MKKAGINVIEFIPFPDHHEFNDGDLKDLAEKAAALDARLITTEKDFVRLPAVFKTKHAPCVLEIELCFESPEAVYAILSSALKNV
mgnify:FL=1